ncbi:MAG TPA: cereblon family protein [Candidatus Obscuribacterales bacterium]
MSNSVSIELEEKTDLQSQKTVRCKNCEHVITSPSLAIEPHEHTFRNPAGYSFHVLCYSDAPGAAEVGDTTDADSWFPGYAWAFAICRQCHNHLGWWYRGSDRFAGLIATRLIR